RQYHVTSTLIVGPDDVWVLDPTPKESLTLVTCYPFDFVGPAPKRYIVKAQRAA
ncbi:MAG: sortase domain-containing protein, partial [bacterium]